MQFSPNTYVLEGPDTHLADLLGAVYDEDRTYRVLRRQGSSTWILFLTLAGGGLLRSAKAEKLALPGSLYLLEPGMMHEYMTSPEAEKWRFAWIHFWPRPHWRPLLEWRHLPGGIRELPLVIPDLEASPEMELCLRVIDLSADSRWLAQAEAMALLELVFIALAKRSGATGAETIDPRIDLAVRFISANLAKPIGVKAIASSCGLSPSRMTELFRRSTGCSPRDYLERERVFRARHLLASTRLPIREVALRSGFASEFYFSSRFKKLSGLSPTAYRQEKQGLPE